MRVRLVPVGEIFRRMPFVVRDLARETGKRVRLELRGQDTEIDKFLIERMMDPILHLVRNAVSHGIETVEERVAAGKSPEGTIVLSAATAGDIVRMEISDDGRGVDAEAVIARAKAAGLQVPQGTPEANHLLSLLCAPGFSTRDESDRASGRGVGMGVVQAAVEELSGSLSLETTPGAGTRFVLELPVTLAITDALIARVGSETFAVPQGSVREVIAVTVSALLQVERNEMTPYRGAALPIVRLGRLFGLPDTTRDRLHVFVVGTGAAALGIAVDRIVGQREIVVRADRRFARARRRDFRRHRSRRRPRRADSRSGGACPAHARASGSGVCGGRSGLDDASPGAAGHRQLHPVHRRGDDLRAAERRGPAHRDDRGHHPRAERAVVRRRGRLFARPGRSGRQPARPLRVRTRPVRPSQPADRGPVGCASDRTGRRFREGVREHSARTPFSRRTKRWPG